MRAFGICRVERAKAGSLALLAAGMLCANLAGCAAPRVSGVPSTSSVQAPESSPTDLIPGDYLKGPMEGGSARLVNGGRALAADDGELHVGWDDSVGWSFEQQSYESDGVVDSEGLVAKVLVSATVEYPQLKDAGEHTDAINAALRDAAMDTVDTYLLHPDDAAREMMLALGGGGGAQPGLFDAELESDVTWAITYNTPDFVSVSFSDVCSIGNAENSFIFLRCVNANLKTGELYRVDDVLTVNEAIANAFVDAIVQNNGVDENGDGTLSDSECYTLDVLPRTAFVKALMGEGDAAHRMQKTFFVDEDGQVNLGVSYWIDNDRGGWVRGWWDAKLSDELLEGAKKDSSFWALIGK